MTENIITQKIKRIGRQQFIRLAVATGALLACGRLPSPSPETVKKTSFEEKLAEMTANAPALVLRPAADGTLVWSDNLFQILKIDFKNPTLLEFIASAQKKVEDLGSPTRIGVMDILNSQVYGLKENKAERLGIQTMEEEIEEGGVCLGRAFLLEILAKKTIPVAQPRILIFSLRIPDRNASHIIVPFEGDDSSIQIADPTFLPSTKPWADYRREFESTNRATITGFSLVIDLEIA